jgi:hypothetical protein
MSTGKSIEITEYNPTALKEITNHLEFSDWEKEPVVKRITFSDFNDYKNAIYTIFDAIEVIGFNGDKIDLGTCGALAQLGKKLLPIEEMNFLDNLLIKNEDSKNVFSKIEKL